MTSLTTTPSRLHLFLFLATLAWFGLGPFAQPEALGEPARQLRVQESLVGGSSLVAMSSACPCAMSSARRSPEGPNALALSPGPTRLTDMPVTSDSPPSPYEEDAALARALLLGDEDAQAWFVAHRLPALARRLSRRWVADLNLEHEDVVQGFLEERVFGEKRARVLGPIADGKRKLLPFLIHCLRNYALDLYRKTKTPPPPPPPPLPPPQPVRPELSFAEHYRLVVELIRTPTPNEFRDPHRAQLLLDCRVSVAKRGGLVVLSKVDVAWTPEEETMLLVRGGPPLGEVWVTLAADFDRFSTGAQSPWSLGSDAHVASVLGCTIASLQRRRSRARETLHELCTAEFERLLPNWIPNKAKS